MGADLKPAKQRMGSKRPLVRVSCTAVTRGGGEHADIVADGAVNSFLPNLKTCGIP